jgi:putative ATP-binding cassette transporter
MKTLGPALRDAWDLSRPYFWHSAERWRALGALVLIVLLNLAMVGLGVYLTFWNREWFNTLQDKNWDRFFALIFTYAHTPEGLMPGWVYIVAVYVLIAIYAFWLRQWLQIRWRAWMTEHLTGAWLSDRAYYRLSLAPDPASPGTDNPDQRIAEDIRDFTGDTLAYGVDLLSSVVNLFSYTAMLWVISGPITLLGLRIPGYMLWIAIIYAIFGTWATHWVGRRLVELNFWQQRLEADFRFGLVRVRENVEGIALHGGEPQEQALLQERFGRVVGNFRAIMNRMKLLNLLTIPYNQAAGVFPIVVAAPRFFANQISLGVLMQITSAFSNVQSALSWFVNNYSGLATWRATVGRLGTFNRALIAARLASDGLRVEPGGAELALEDATLRLPDGTVLLDKTRIAFPPGEATVISGPSGAGKSTLFRALAGIWPFAEGRLRRPTGTYLFLPQRPYIPLGTLRRALAYPGDPAAHTEAELREALEEVGLGRLTGELDRVENWSLRLSGGEQQRLAIARALLARPDFLFLDEATASLDPAAEEALYGALHRRLPGTTIVSIAHRESVARQHRHRLVLDRRPGAPARISPAEAA